MKSSRWLHTFAIAILALSTSMALAQHEDHGHGRDHNKHGNEDEDYDNARKGYSNKVLGYKDHGHGYDVRDHEVMHGWYQSHRGNLPPSLAKKDRLPPGLERQLELRGTLPPGLKGRIYAVPVDLERELPRLLRIASMSLSADTLSS
jgi:hypothetical protein